MFGRAFLACTLLVLALPDCALAQAWPTRQPIKLMVPFPPGSSLDTIARPVFEQVGRQIGQTFVFENRPGAGGTLGMALVAKADPDGYTLLVNSSIQTIVPTTFAKLPFDTARDFAAIIPLGQFPNVLVSPAGRFKTVQDLVAKAKEKPGLDHLRLRRHRRRDPSQRRALPPRAPASKRSTFRFAARRTQCAKCSAAASTSISRRCRRSCR